MQRSVLTAACMLGAIGAWSYQSAPGWNIEDALDAQSVEMRLDENGRPLEVEYHVSPDQVPANVMGAMDALHPGGRAIGAEKEYVGSTLYWEVTKAIDGREFEAMFLPNGELHSEELEVSATDVPPAVREAVQARIDGDVTKWEEIRDGNRDLVEYHAKATADGKKYKLIVSADGSVLGVLREMPAEIEVELP